jgi:hypothetical protein
VPGECRGEGGTEKAMGAVAVLDPRIVRKGVVSRMAKPQAECPGLPEG